MGAHLSLSSNPRYVFPAQDILFPCYALSDAFGCCALPAMAKGKEERKIFKKKKISHRLLHAVRHAYRTTINRHTTLRPANLGRVGKLCAAGAKGQYLFPGQWAPATSVPNRSIGRQFEEHRENGRSAAGKWRGQDRETSARVLDNWISFRLFLASLSPPLAHRFHFPVVPGRWYPTRP